MRNGYEIFVGKPEGDRPHVRSRLVWEDNIKMNLREMGWDLWTGYFWLRIATSGWLL
jgi:hypothetical protein